LTAPPSGTTPLEPLDLHALQVGAVAARQELHRRFAAVIHGIAVSVVGPSDADDVTQDVFLKVFHRIADLRDAAALPAWLCGIARNAAVDHLRRRKRQQAAPLESDPQARDGDGGAEAELAARVLDVVRSLPEAYRETLVLRLVEGLSGSEIAARTGLTHGSVRVNLHRGMGLLRPLLEPLLSREGKR
jgi:RNA polymerase sigma-70 factor (ECF subfamily)